MTDDLRSRLARAIYNEVLETSDGYVEGQEADSSVDPADPDEALTVDCRITFTDLADAVLRELHPERCCELCGRTGTQQFSPTRTGWVCRSVYACNRRAAPRRPRRLWDIFADADTNSE